MLVLSERCLLSNVPVFIEKLSDDNKIEPVDFALSRKKSMQLHDFLLADFKLKSFYIFMNDTLANLKSTAAKKKSLSQKVNKGSQIGNDVVLIWNIFTLDIYLY